MARNGWNQRRMFEVEDLPLFSGAAPTAQAEVFAPAVAVRQEELPELAVACKYCKDTGLHGGWPCPCCDTGRALRAERAEQKLVEDVRSLSSGTIGSLIGSKWYAEIDLAHQEFVAFVIENPSFDRWQFAWLAFERSQLRAEAMGRGACSFCGHTDFDEEFEGDDDGPASLCCRKCGETFVIAEELQGLLEAGERFYCSHGLPTDEHPTCEAARCFDCEQDEALDFGEGRFGL